MMRQIKTALLFSLALLVLIGGCVTTTRSSTKKEVEAREQLGNSLLREGKYQDALEALLEAAKLDPDSASIQNALGLTYQSLKEYDQAILHYKRALQLKPNSPEIQNNLGTVYALLRQWDMAIVYFQKAADDVLYRTRHFAFLNLGAAYHRKGEYRKAIESYKRALEFFPGYSTAYDHMGLSYEALEEWDRAMGAYQRSIEIDPESPVPHLRLGSLYLQLNRHQEAAEEFLATIRTDPQGPYGQEARRLLEEAQKTE
jgi:Tfp pilus assembly protein PilF